MKEMPKEKRGGDVISDVSNMVTKLTDFYNQVKEKTPIVKTILRDPNAQKIAKKALGSSIGGVMDDIAKYMEMVGLGHMTHDREMVRRVGGSKSFKEWAKEEAKEHQHGGRIGMGVQHSEDNESQMDPATLKKYLAMKKGGLGEASWSEHQMDPALLKKFMAMKGGRIGMGEATYGEFRKIGPLVKKHEPEPEPEEEFPESEGNGVPAEWLNRMKEKARMEGGAGALEKAALVHLARKGSGKAKALLRKCGLTPTGRVRKGGDDETFFQKVTRYAKQVYDFLAENKEDIHALLESPKFNENLPKAAGGPTQIPKQIASALKMVGLGHRRGRGAAEDAKKQIDDQIAALQDQKSKIQASASAVKGKGRRGGAEAVFRKTGPSIHDLMAQQFGHYTGGAEAVASSTKSRAQRPIWETGYTGGGSDAAYMSGGVGRDDAQQHFGAAYPLNGYKPQARLNNLAPDSAGGWGAEEQNMSKKGGRKPSAYASFVKEYAAKHPGPDLMKRAAAAWRSR